MNTNGMTPAEAVRRASNTDKVLALFQARPLTWISVDELMRVGGTLAWRTRVSNARTRAKKDGYTIVWNGEIQTSAYMYRPIPIARPAESRPVVEQKPRQASLLSL